MDGDKLCATVSLEHAEYVADLARRGIEGKVRDKESRADRHVLVPGIAEVVVIVMGFSSSSAGAEVHDEVLAIGRNSHSSIVGIFYAIKLHKADKRLSLGVFLCVCCVYP